MISWASFSRQPFLPAGLSFLRGVLGIGLPFLLLHPSPVFHLAAAFLFTFAALTDYWDGLLARRYHSESDFGKILDPTMDKILILVPLAFFSFLGLYSPWWLVPIFVREIGVTFCRIGWLLEGKAVGAEKLGKWKFGVQVVALACAFLYFISFDFSFLVPWRHGLEFLKMISLAAAIFLTLLSGFSFLRANRAHFQSPRFARFTGALGVGLIPFAPGTWGTAAGLGVVLLTHWNGWLYAAVCFLLGWAGYWAVSRIDLSADKDPPFVVMDEACGIFLPFVAIPLTVSSVLAGFFLFRLLDVLKPYPLRRLEKLPGWWGILCDDLGAGFYAWLLMRVLFR